MNQFFFTFHHSFNPLPSPPFLLLLALSLSLSLSRSLSLCIYHSFHIHPSLYLPLCLLTPSTSLHTRPTRPIHPLCVSVRQTVSIIGLEPPHRHDALRHPPREELTHTHTNTLTHTHTHTHTHTNTHTHTHPGLMCGNIYKVKLQRYEEHSCTFSGPQAAMET